MAEGRTPSPDGTTTPPGDYQSWDAYMRAVEDDARVDGYDPILCARITKAMRLAPNVLVFRALLDGQQVPADALDQRWRKQYRL